MPVLPAETLYSEQQPNQQRKVFSKINLTAKKVRRKSQEGTKRGTSATDCHMSNAILEFLRLMPMKMIMIACEVERGKVGNTSAKLECCQILLRPHRCHSAGRELFYWHLLWRSIVREVRAPVAGKF